MTRRIALAALVMALTSFVLAPAAPLFAEPGGPAPGAVEIEGATYAELDEGTGLLTLRGNPVLVRRGAMSVRALSIVYDTRNRVLRASARVAYADALLTVEAAEATIWVDEERVLAEGGVEAAQGQGVESVRLRAARVEVLGRERRMVATGGTDLRTSDGTVSGERLEASLAREEFIAEGGARLVRDDIEGRAPRIAVRRREGIAVLSGGATVRQGRNETRADTVTVDLRRRRFTAAGHAQVLVYPSP